MTRIKSCCFPVKNLVIICFLAMQPHSLFSQVHTIDSLLNLVETMKEDTSKAKTYGALCRAYMVELNDMDKVMLYASKAFTLSQSLHYKRGLGFGTFYLGLCYWTKGDFKMAIHNFEKAAILLSEAGEKNEEAACYINIGQVYTELGKYAEALKYIQKGLRFKEEVDDKQGIQSGYISIGNLYILQGNYSNALVYFLKSLKLAEERNDQIFVTYANNNIGDVFFAQNKLDMALLYYKKAVKYLEEIKEVRVAGSIYTGIGNVYWKKKLYKEALTYHLKDLNLKENYGDKQGIAIACNKIGLDYIAMQQFEKALSYQLKSFNLCKEIGYTKGIVDASGGVGKVYEEKKDFSKALQYYDEMLRIAKEINFKEGIRDAYENEASVYTKLKQFDQALQYTELFNDAKDSLLNKENLKQVTELNTRYDTDKKEKEILLLTKDQELNAKIIKQQQLTRWGLIAGLGLLSISVFSIYRRYRFKQNANVILEKQKEEIEQKNTLITDSIDYAKTIQEAVLPTKQEISALIPGSFILYKPKATVSGDFYWVSHVNERLVCAVADCTGHGVPGAFMSLLGYNMLENAVKDLHAIEPAAILNTLNEEVSSRLAGSESGENSKHGMDISLIALNKKTNQLEFAGAHNSIYIVRANELIELKADKMGIGGNTRNPFSTQRISLQKGDMLYLFTDGFPDQIGGPKRKKFYYQPFKNLLMSISELHPEEQREKLDEAHLLWMGEKMDQTDDILIMGMRID